MTKLVQFLTFVSVFIAIWYSLLNNYIKSKYVDEWRSHIIWSPFYLIFAFGIYSVVVVLWRVFTFNDCPEAAKEIQQQIEEAREDLRKKGLKV